MKTIKRIFPPNVSSHIHLDFGDGLMRGLEYNKKKKKKSLTKFSCVFVYTDSILFVVGARSEIWETSKGVGAQQSLFGEY